MPISNNITTIAPLEYDAFFGLDVDKQSIAVTIVDHGQKIKSMKMPYNADALINYTKKHFPDKRIAFAYEAGPTGYGLYDQLVGADYTCLVISPSMVPKPPSNRVKTNRLDSKRLAKALRGGELIGIRVPSRKYRDLRHLTHLYKTTVMQSKQYKCRIKALLLTEGLHFPDCPGHNHWSGFTIKRLEAISCSSAIRFKLDMLLENLRFYRQQLLKVNKELRRLFKNDLDLFDSARFLRSIPGIGWTISTVFLSRVGDWRHLKNVRELSGFTGLSPREYSTGENIIKGSITRTGDSYLRSILIEGAWIAINKDPELYDFYKRIYNRHPLHSAARKAIVAVARKLTARMYAVLTQRRLYKVKNIEYNKFVLKNISSKKRRHNAPQDASTNRRTHKRYALGGSISEKETSGLLYAQRAVF